jgi:hypothetical protein
MLVEVRIAYGEGLDALLEITDRCGLVRAESPTDGVSEFWAERCKEYRTWLDEGQRNGRNLLGVLAWRVNHGHNYRVLRAADGSLVPDDHFDQAYGQLLAERGPAAYERILRVDRGISLPGLPARRP